MLDPAGVGVTTQPLMISWTPKDCALYALGVGAGVNDLAFTTDNTEGVPPQMLPTMPAILGLDSRVYESIGEIDWLQVVHAEQSVEILADLPVDGRGVATSHVAELWDKGKAAVIVTCTEVRDHTTGAPLFTSRSALYVRGAGGFGGERGPVTEAVDMPRESYQAVTYDTPIRGSAAQRVPGRSIWTVCGHLIKSLNAFRLGIRRFRA